MEFYNFWLSYNKNLLAANPYVCNIVIPYVTVDPYIHFFDVDNRATQQKR